MDWTPTHDTAIAFGSALGMSRSQIARCLGPEFTRSMVIGRGYRLGIAGENTDSRPRRERSARLPKEPRPPKERRPRPNAWTSEQDALVAAHFGQRLTSAESGAIIGRSESSVDMRRMHLGLKRFSPRRYSAEDDQIIRADYAAHVPLIEMAKKLNRSFQTIRQRIFHLGIRRSARMTRLVDRYGPDVLALGNDPAQIRQRLKEREALQKLEREASKALRIKGVLDGMEQALANGEDRVVAFKAALIQGATLDEIGQRVGLTRERIRQLTTPGYKPTPCKKKFKPREPRTITCHHCKTEFSHQGRGNKKFCDPCIEERRKEYMRAYAPGYRAANRQIVNDRNRTHMRTHRAAEKLLAMSREEQLRVLAQIAARLDRID